MGRSFKDVIGAFPKKELAEKLLIAQDGVYRHEKPSDLMVY